MGRMIDFARPDGSRCGGYFADAGEDAPSVVVIQEWCGLNDQICGVADRFARSGFSALAPDLFHGRVTGDPDEANHLMSGLDFPGATHQDIRGAVELLAARGSKVGVMGFCMGGALTIAAAVHVPGVAAAVCFYGIPPQEFADPAAIRIPFQAHFARHDNWCTPAAAHALNERMQGAGQIPDIHHYDADHAFFNERRADVYDANCANRSWDRTVTFFKQHLG